MVVVAVLVAPAGAIEEVPAVRVVLVGTEVAPAARADSLVALAGTDHPRTDRPWAALATAAGDTDLRHRTAEDPTAVTAAAAVCFLSSAWWRQSSALLLCCWFDRKLLRH